MTAEERCNFGLCDKKAKRRGNEGSQAGEAAVGKACRLPRKRLQFSMYLVYLVYLPGVVTRGGKALLPCRRRAEAVPLSSLACEEVYDG